MMSFPINLGTAAINGSSGYGDYGSGAQTCVEESHPAAMDGWITEVEFYAKGSGQIKLATFYYTTGGKWKCRAVSAQIASGAGHQTYSGLALRCLVGDCIGFYGSAGCYTSWKYGGVGQWWRFGDGTTPLNTEYSYSHDAPSYGGILGHGYPTLVSGNNVNIPILGPVPARSIVIL